MPSDYYPLDFEQRQEASDLEARVVDDPEGASRAIVFLRGKLKAAKRYAALRTEIEALREQDGIDALCYYRNLAIAFGAERDDMLSECDRRIWDGHRRGETWETLHDERAETRDVWAEVEALREEIRLLREQLAVDDQMISGYDDELEALRAELTMRDKDATFFEDRCQVLREEIEALRKVAEAARQVVDSPFFATAEPGSVLGLCNALAALPDPQPKGAHAPSSAQERDVRPGDQECK